MKVGGQNHVDKDDVKSIKVDCPLHQHTINFCSISGRTVHFQSKDGLLYPGTFTFSPIQIFHQYFKHQIRSLA